MSERICELAHGTEIKNGDDLRAHFRAGGFVRVMGNRKWYRAIANKLEVLHDNSHEWESASWDLDELVEHTFLTACLEPQLSKDIAERDRIASEVGAPKLERHGLPICKCDGCRKSIQGYSILNLSWCHAGLMVSMAGHGHVAGHLIERKHVIELRAEIDTWLERTK